MNIKTKKALSFAFIFLIMAMLYLPILVLIIFSFTNTKTMGSFDGFTFSLYADVFSDSEMMEAVLNTFIIAISSSLLATFIGTISAVGIFYLRKMTRSVANTLNQITVINADIVTGIAFMMFFLVFKFIPKGYPTLIISHTVITIPYVILSVLPRLSQLNPNSYEAGLDLGASPMRALFTVVMPQLIPSMISGFAMAFTLSLDDFVVTKFNNAGGQITTISTYLYNKLAKSSIPAAMRAFSTILFVVSLLILILINIYSRKKAKQNALMI